MNQSMTTQELRDQLTAHLDTVTPPMADLDAVKRRSRRQRVRRVAGPGLMAVAAVGIGALVLTQTVDPTGPGGSAASGGDVVSSESPPPMNAGLRAYASPGENIYLGGRELPYDIEGLDTDAVVTPAGILHYDGTGSPVLLQPSGDRVEIGSSPSQPPRGFRPTIKADALRLHVVFAVMDGDAVTLTVYDLKDRTVVATTDITCPDGCEDLVLDGIDSGAVFVRLSTGTSIWDYERRESYRFAGRDTRVADVRNGVVLYDGPAPTQNTEEWRLVPGAIDAQLTFDGEHVLYWSDELTSTASRGTSVIKLDLPVPATFFTFDTDGSVLAATVDDPSTVYDCDIPSGACEEVGEVSTDGGDLQFVGSDM